MATTQKMALFQRHFNSEIEEVVDSRTITFKQLSQHFHLPINEVAKKLGVCLTVLKKVCRKQGIPRWPYRKLKSLDKSIESLKNSAMNCPADAHSILQEIENLEKQKIEICQNPSILVQDVHQTAEFDSPPQPFTHLLPQQYQQQLRLTLAMCSQSDPPPKKKREMRQMNIKTHPQMQTLPTRFTSLPTIPSSSQSSGALTGDFSITQFSQTTGGVFSATPSPPPDAVAPSPQSPSSPNSPNGNPFARTPTTSTLQQTPTTSGRTRKRDAIESPFSPFSSFNSSQLFGSPSATLTHQLPQLEQKLRETCLSPNTPFTQTLPPAAPPPPTALFSTTKGTTTTATTTATTITNPALLPSFQELVSFQAIPAPYYRSQLGSVTPDMPRPSKRMREGVSPGGEIFIPSLENFTPH